jgi:hypothetical protein
MIYEIVREEALTISFIVHRLGHPAVMLIPLWIFQRRIKQRSIHQDLLLFA